MTTHELAANLLAQLNEELDFVIYQTGEILTYREITDHRQYGGTLSLVLNQITREPGEFTDEEFNKMIETTRQLRSSKLN